MALCTVRNDLHNPPLSRTYTSFGSVITLHQKSPSAPDVPVDHLPCGMFVNADAADVLAYKDALGVVNTITFAAAVSQYLPITASTLETTTTCNSVTVCWNVEP